MTLWEVQRPPAAAPATWGPLNSRKRESPAGPGLIWTVPRLVAPRAIRGLGSNFCVVFHEPDIWLVSLAISAGAFASGIETAAASPVDFCACFVFLPACCAIKKPQQDTASPSATKRKWFFPM